MTSHSDDRYLKVGDLTDWLGVARSTIYRWVDQDHFPKPVVLDQKQTRTAPHVGCVPRLRIG